MLRDGLFNRGKVQLLPPVDNGASTFVSKILDTQSAGKALITISVGAMAGFVANTNYVTPVLQESDTTVGADFTQVNAVFTGDINDLSDTGALALNKIYRLGYLGTKRYIRVNFVVTGTITTSFVSVIGELEPGLMPAQDFMPLAITAT